MGHEGGNRVLHLVISFIKCIYLYYHYHNYSLIYKSIHYLQAGPLVILTSFIVTLYIWQSFWCFILWLFLFVRSSSPRWCLINTAWPACTSCFHLAGDIFVNGRNPFVQVEYWWVDNFDRYNKTTLCSAWYSKIYRIMLFDSYWVVCFISALVFHRPDLLDLLL